MFAAMPESHPLACHYGSTANTGRAETVINQLAALLLHRSRMKRPLVSLRYLIEFSVQLLSLAREDFEMVIVFTHNKYKYCFCIGLITEDLFARSGASVKI